MDEKIYIRLDVDNVGEGIELSLLNKDINTAQDIHDSIQSNMKEMLEKMKGLPSISLLMVGCDDILLSMEKKEFNLDFFENLRKNFHAQTGFTISIGIGDTLLKTLFNLKIAKLSGKNKVITELQNPEF